MKCCLRCSIKYRTGLWSCEDSCKQFQDEKKQLEEENAHRKNAIEWAKQHKMDDLTLDIVQKRELGIPTRRTYE